MTGMTISARSPALPLKHLLFLCSLVEALKPMTNPSQTIRMWTPLMLLLTLLRQIATAWTGWILPSLMYLGVPLLQDLFHIIAAHYGKLSSHELFLDDRGVVLRSKKPDRLLLLGNPRPSQRSSLEREWILSPRLRLQSPPLISVVRRRSRRLSRYPSISPRRPRKPQSLAFRLGKNSLNRS
jgi:hypothetical protein